MKSTDVCAALKRYFGRGDSAAVLFEVSNGTGAHARRHLDCIVFDLWPSRGLSLHGIEVKVSRSDFRREIANGAKAEEVAQYCDYFSIAAPVGTIPKAELPKAWGLLEVNQQGVLKEVHRPTTKLNPRPLTRSFVAALVRSAGKLAVIDVDNLLRAERQKLYAGFDAEVTRQIEYNDKDGALWRKLIADLGDVDYVSDVEIIKAVRYVIRSGAVSSYKNLGLIVKALEDSLTRLKQAEAWAGLAQPKKEKLK